MNKDVAEVQALARTAQAAAVEKRASARSARAKREARLQNERLANFRRGISGS